MMVSIEHGHEKKHGGHESPKGKHGQWKEHALTALKTAGIFAFAALAGPPMLAAVGIVVPKYILGAAASIGYLANKDDPHHAPKKEKGGDHGGH